MTTCFYSAQKGSIVDVSLRLDSIDTNVGQFSRKTFEQLKEETPDLVAMDLDAASELIYTSTYNRLKGVEVITRANYIDALECMPPLRWSVGAGAESFRLQEAISGPLHSSYVALAEGQTTRYFCLVAPITASHDDLVREVREALAAKAIKAIAR